MKVADKEAVEKLQKIINGDFPGNIQVSIAYAGGKTGKAELEEMERFSKNLHSRMGKRPGAIF